MEKQSRWQNAMRFGLIMGGVLVVTSLILYLLGMVDMETGKSNFLGTLLNFVITIGAIWMGISAYKQGQGGYLSIGDGVKQGLLISLIGGIIVGIYTLIFFQFIEPDMLENMREMALAQAEEQGSVNEDTEEMVNSMMNIFMSPLFFFVTSILVQMIFGLIFGLIFGAIMKEERPYMPQDEPGSV